MNRMRGYLHAICVISFAICVLLSSAQEGNHTAHTINENSSFLDVNNEIRRNASVQPLTWSDELTATAQGWVNTCNVYILTTETSIRFLGSSYPTERTPERVLAPVVREKRFFDSGQTIYQCCYHGVTHCCEYAKVVNPQFRSLGCGEKICNLTQARYKRYYNVYVAVCIYSN